MLYLGCPETKKRAANREICTDTQPQYRRWAEEHEEGPCWSGKPYGCKRAANKGEGANNHAGDPGQKEGAIDVAVGRPKTAKCKTWETHHKIAGEQRRVTVTHVQVGNSIAAKERPIAEKGQTIMSKKAAKSR